MPLHVLKLSDESREPLTAHVAFLDVLPFRLIDDIEAAGQFKQSLRFYMFIHGDDTG